MRTPEEIARTRAENLALSAAEEAAWVGPKPVWWLSFVDPDMVVPPEERRPMGPSFLGVAIVEAVGPIGATGAAWACGANPGGEVMTTGPFPAGCIDRKWMNRLLSREDLAELEKENG